MSTLSVDTPKEEVNIKQLTSVLQNLQLQFGSIASSLTEVVQQLAIIQKQQQTTNQSPAATTSPDNKLPNIQHKRRLSSTLNPLSPLVKPSVPVASKAIEDVWSESSDEENDLHHHIHPEVGGGGVTVDDGDTTAPSDDEEAEEHLNRIYKARDDELENEVSETSGKMMEKEHSISSLVRNAARTAKHKLQRSKPRPSGGGSISQPANETTQSNSSTSPKVKGMANTNQVAPGASTGSAATSSSQVHRASQSVPALPLTASMINPPITPSSSISNVSTLTHTSPQLAPFLRKSSIGNGHPHHHLTNSSTSSFIIPPSTTALPLDAPDQTPTPTSPSLTQRSIFPHIMSPTTHRAVSPPRSMTHMAMMQQANTSGASSPRAHAHSISADTLSEIHNQHIWLHHENKVKLNVGGQLFCTTLSTLLREPASMFSGMFSGHFNLNETTNETAPTNLLKESIFIDRDPTMFRHVLNYLRDGSICLDGMTQVQKKSLMKEARYFGLAGLLSLLQLDSRATKTAQRRELSSEKEYKLVEDVPQKEIAQVIKLYTMAEGYEFENWLNSAPIPTKPTSSSKSSSVTPSTGVHLLFSKKLSRGELMLLDRLQNHM